MTRSWKGGRWRRLGRWAGRALLVAIGLFALVWLTRGAWLHPWLVARVERLAEERLGAELTIGAFESSWFGGAELRDVTWTASRPPLLALDAPRVRAQWSLLGLLTGSDRWLRRIEAEVDEVELATAPAVEPAPDESPSAPPPHLPAIEARVGRLVYRLSEASAVEVDGATLTVSEPSEKAGEALALEADAVTWRDGDRTVTRPAQVAARYDEGRIELAPSSLGDLVSISSGELDLGALDRGVISWSVAARTLDGALTSSGTLVDGRPTLSFSADELVLARLEDVLGPVFPAAMKPGLMPSLSVVGELEAAPDGEGLALSLDWIEARTPDLIVRGAELGAALDGGDWRELLRGAHGRVLIEDAERAAVEGGLPAFELAVTAELDAGRATLGGGIETAGGALDVTRGELAFGAGERLLADARADVDLEASFDDLGPLGAIFGMEWSGELQGLIEISGALLTPTGRLEADARDVVIDGLPLGTVDLNVVAAGGRVDVLDCEVESDGWAGSLAGTWVAAERSVEGVQLEVSGGGIELGPLTPGAFSLSVAADGAIDGPAGAFSLTVEDLGASGFEELDLRTAGGFEGRAVRLDSLLAEDGELALTARGQASFAEGGDFAVRFEELELTGPDGVWTLAEPATAAQTGQRLELETALISLVPDAQTPEGRDGRALIEWTGDALSASFEHFEAGPLRGRVVPAHWSSGGLSGSVRSELEGAGRATAFELGLEGFVAARGDNSLPPRDVDLSGALGADGVLDLRLGFAPLSLELRAPLDPGGEHPLQPGPVKLSLASGPLELVELGPLLGLPPGVEGRAAVNAELEGSWKDLRGTATVTGAGLTSPETVAALGGALDLDVALVLGDRVKLERGEIVGPDGPLLSFGGSLETAPDLTAWVSAPETLLEAPLSIDGNFALPLGGWAARIESVRRLTGAADGILQVGGTLSSPEPTGTVSFSEVELRLTSSMPSIRNLNAELEVRPDGAHVVDMGLEFGGAPCSVTGDLTWGGPELTLEELRLEGENLLIARSSTTRVRADASVAINGPLSALATTGEIVITEGRFAQDIDLLSGLFPGGGRQPSANTSGQLNLSLARTGPLATATFDLSVRSKGPMRFKGNLYEINARPELTVSGTGEVPIFVGEVYIDPSKLSLPSGKLEVDSGVLRFSQADPFRPRVTISAGMETRGYDIDANITGQIGETEILLSSSPPLANDQLLLLFLTGQTPDTGSKGMAAAQTVGVYLAQDVLVRWISGGSTEADSLLDDLVFEVGADVTETGAPTLEARYYLSSRRKRLGRTTYLLAEKDVWDKTNFGFGIRFRFP